LNNNSNLQKEKIYSTNNDSNIYQKSIKTISNSNESLNNKKKILEENVIIPRSNKNKNIFDQHLCKTNSTSNNNYETLDNENSEETSEIVKEENFILKNVSNEKIPKTKKNSRNNVNLQNNGENRILIPSKLPTILEDNEIINNISINSKNLFQDMNENQTDINEKIHLDKNDLLINHLKNNEQIFINKDANNSKKKKNPDKITENKSDRKDENLANNINININNNININFNVNNYNDIKEQYKNCDEKMRMFMNRTMNNEHNLKIHLIHEEFKSLSEPSLKFKSKLGNSQTHPDIKKNDNEKTHINKKDPLIQGFQKETNKVLLDNNKNSLNDKFNRINEFNAKEQNLIKNTSNSSNKIQDENFKTKKIEDDLIENRIELNDKKNESNITNSINIINQANVNYENKPIIKNQMENSQNDKARNFANFFSRLNKSNNSHNTNSNQENQIKIDSQLKQNEDKNIVETIEEKSNSFNIQIRSQNQSPKKLVINAESEIIKQESHSYDNENDKNNIKFNEKEIKLQEKLFEEITEPNDITLKNILENKSENSNKNSTFTNNLIGENTLSSQQNQIINSQVIKSYETFNPGDYNTLFNPIEDPNKMISKEEINSNEFIKEESETQKIKEINNNGKLNCDSDVISINLNKDFNSNEKNNFNDIFLNLQNNFLKKDLNDVSKILNKTNTADSFDMEPLKPNAPLTSRDHIVSVEEEINRRLHLRKLEKEDKNYNNSYSIIKSDPLNKKLKDLSKKSNIKIFNLKFAKKNNLISSNSWNENERDIKIEEIEEINSGNQLYNKNNNILSKDNFEIKDDSKKNSNIDDSFMDEIKIAKSPKSPSFKSCDIEAIKIIKNEVYNPDNEEILNKQQFMNELSSNKIKFL